MGDKRLIDKRLYVACLDLSERACLVVGAGTVGLEKIEGLLACDATVKVVAPEAIAEVRELASAGRIEWHRRTYASEDLEGCFLVIAATSDTRLNTRVYEDAEARSMLVNVVDVPDLCNFILPAIVRQGPLAVAISTAGASPALAKRMKREIAARFGPHHARLAEMLHDVRAWTQASLPTYQDRKAFFEGIVNGDPDPLELLRAGDEPAVRALIEEAKRRSAQSG